MARAARAGAWAATRGRSCAERWEIARGRVPFIAGAGDVCRARLRGPPQGAGSRRAPKARASPWRWGPSRPAGPAPRRLWWCSRPAVNGLPAALDADRSQWNGPPGRAGCRPQPLERASRLCRMLVVLAGLGLPAAPDAARTCRKWPPDRAGCCLYLPEAASPLRRMPLVPAVNGLPVAPDAARTCRERPPGRAGCRP